MNRLTRRSKVGEGLPVKHLNLRHEDTTSEETLTEILDKLTEYEDTELEPNEILTGLELAQIACMQIKYKKMQGVLEAAAEEIENVYGRETELTNNIRELLN